MADIRELLANIKWSQEKYSPASLVKRRNQFPNIIKITRITNGEREEELCRANAWVEQMRVMSRDKKGRLISFPLNFPVKFQVIHRGSTARIKMKTLKSLVKKGDLPITVRIDPNKSFHDDGGLGQAAVMDDFTVMHKYVERFLVCNAIKGVQVLMKNLEECMVIRIEFYPLDRETKASGNLVLLIKVCVLKPAVTLVPQYAELEIELCQGLIQGPKEHWRILHNTFDFAARDIPFSKIQGSQAILLHTRESGVSSQGAAVRPVQQSRAVPEVAESSESRAEPDPAEEPLYAKVNKSRGDRQDDLFSRQLETELTSETLDSVVGHAEVNSNSNNTEQKTEREEIVQAAEEQQTLETNDQLQSEQNSTKQNSRESTLVRVGTVENVVSLGSESSSATQVSECSKQEGHDFNNNVQEVDERLSEKFDDLYATVTRDQDKNNFDGVTKPGITTILVTADDNSSNIAYTHRDTSLSASTGNLQLAAQQEAEQSQRHNSMASYRPRERVYSRDTASELSQSGDRIYGTALIHNGKSAVDYGTKDHNGKIPTFYSMTDLRIHGHHPRTQRSHERRRMRRSEGSAQYHNQTLPPAITRIHTSSVMSGYEEEPRHYSASTLDNAELYKSSVYIPPDDEDDYVVRREPSQQQLHIKVNKPRKNKGRSEDPQFTNIHGVNESHNRPTGKRHNSGALHISINGGGERSNVWSPVSPTTLGSTASMPSPGAYSDDPSEIDPRYVNGYNALIQRQRGRREQTVPQRQPGNLYQKAPQPRDQQKKVAAKKKNRSAYNQRQQSRSTRSSSRGSGSSYRTSSVAIEEEDFDIPGHITVNANYQQQQNRSRNYYGSSNESETDSDEDNMDDNVVNAEEFAKPGDKEFYTRDKDYFYHTTGKESGLRKRNDDPSPSRLGTMGGWTTTSSVEYNAAKSRSQENERNLSSNSVFDDDQSESSDEGPAVEAEIISKVDRKDFPKQVLNFAIPDKTTKTSTSKIPSSIRNTEVVEGNVRQIPQAKQAYQAPDRQTSVSSKDTHDESAVPSGERRISIINVGGEPQVTTNSTISLSSPRSDDTPTSPNTEMRQIFGNIIADAKSEAFKEIDKMDDNRIQADDKQKNSSQVSITTHEQGKEKDVTVTMTGITSPPAQAKPPALDFSSELQQKLAKRMNSMESPKENATEAGYGYVPAGLSTLEREKGGYQIRSSHGRLASKEDQYITKSGHVKSNEVSKDYYVAPSVKSSKASESTKSSTTTTTTKVTKKTSSASKSNDKPAVEIHIENASRSNSTKKVDGPKKSVAYPAVAKSEYQKSSKENTSQQATSTAPVMRSKEAKQENVATVKPTSQADKPKVRPVSTISQIVDSTLPDQQEMETSHLETLHDSIKDLDDYLKSQDPDAISQISARSSRHMEHFNFTLKDGKSSEMTFF
ncbi:hypothetical protein CAPTEDRAFT_200071 [Capitella teleta]|uniref:Uncharacterized protein n=1 Tax=Capitella teleta TaxID=283909 RepID=R7TQN8_CAPTE|nr:hypothetical protein CAPTEDRAFT_200071 [Capitella teleta]|eukprot:ELT95872.1 hypothetical protein CAPTEDRAFT_200071 [Capitella teleta]